MSIKNSIKDGQGSNLEACVKETPPEENALCVNISGISPRTAISVIPFASGGQADGFLTQNADGTTTNAAVNGSLGSPIEFRLNPLVGSDFIVNEILILGLDGAIKLNNWIGSNSALTNGCILEVRADSVVTTFPNFYKTLDLAAFSSIGGFDLLSEQSGDMVRCIREFQPLLILRAQDTFGTSASQQDYVTWTVQDSHSGIDEIRVQVRGFLTDPGEY
jgi:hypothetical protein